MRIPTLPDFAGGVVATANALASAPAVVDALEAAIDRFAQHRWDRGSLPTGGIAWSRGSLTLSRPDPGSPLLRVFHADLRTMAHGAIRVDHAPVPATGDPLGAARHAVACVRAALDAARRGVAPTWEPDAAFEVALRSVLRPSERHGQALLVPGSPLAHASITLRHVNPSTMRALGDVVELMPTLPCRLLVRSRAGRGGVSRGSAPAVELRGPSAFMGLPPLDAVARLRLEAAAAAIRTRRR